MIHKFKIGQSVVYLPTNRGNGIGRYVVLAVLRQRDGTGRYRIRSNDDPSREYTAEQKSFGGRGIFLA